MQNFRGVFGVKGEMAPFCLFPIFEPAAGQGAGRAMGAGGKRVSFFVNEVKAEERNKFS